VPSYAAPERRTHALSVFYTITIGAAASPPVAGFIGDLIGIPGTVAVVSALTLAKIRSRSCSRTRAIRPPSEVAWKEPGDMIAASGEIAEDRTFRSMSCGGRSGNQWRPS
jgi:hypothetical protein